MRSEIGSRLGLQDHVVRKIEASESLKKLALRLERLGGSGNTVRLYVVRVDVFCRWLGMDPDQALRQGWDAKRWKEKLESYLDHIVVDEQLARSTAESASASVKKWLEVCGGVDVGRVEVGRTWAVESDRIPTRAELRQILGAAGLFEKVQVMVALSSGLRISSILALRLKDVDLVTTGPDGKPVEREIPVIKPPPETTKNRRAFVTFLSPEAKEVIKAYLRERQERGEALAPESHLIVSERPLGRPITSVSGEVRWERLLRRAGTAEKGRSWHLLRFHTLRKYFKSWSSLAGVTNDSLEFMLGHRGSLAQTYFLGSTITPEVVAILEKEYRKALPMLEIFNEGEKVATLEKTVEELQGELQKLKSAPRDEIEELKADYNDLRARFDVVMAAIGSPTRTPIEAIRPLAPLTKEQEQEALAKLPRRLRLHESRRDVDR